MLLTDIGYRPLCLPSWKIHNLPSVSRRDGSTHYLRVIFPRKAAIIFNVQHSPYLGVCSLAREEVEGRIPTVSIKRKETGEIVH